MGSEPTTTLPRDVSPLQALSFLWRGRWWIVLCTLLGAAGGVFLAQQRGTILRARSVLYVQREAAVLPGSEVSVWLQSRNYANTQAALLRSTPVLDAAMVLAEPATPQLYGDSHNRLAWLRRNLNVAVGIEDDLISVSLDSVHVDESCALVNAVVEAYLAHRARNQRETATGVLATLQRDLQRYEAELRTVQTEQVEFLARHPGVSLVREASNFESERLRELGAALTRAELEAMQAESAWRAASNQAASADPLQRLSLPGVDLAMTRAPLESLQQLQQLRQRRLQLLQDVTGDHPSLQQLDAVISGLEAQLGAEAARVAEAHVATMAQRHQASKQLFDDLQQRVRDQEQRLHAVDPAQAEYRGLEIRFERARKIADALYERIRSININERMDAKEQAPVNAFVYEYATPAGAMVASSKTSFASIATLLGLLLGVTLAWLRMLGDQRLRSVGEVAALLPVLAALPRVRIDRHGVVATWSRAPDFAAAMRALHAALHFGERLGAGRVLQVTSPRDGDGKSLVAAGLAVAAARAGQRTLLVDADLGRARQAQLFACPGHEGLGQLLAGAPPGAAAVVATGVANLSLLRAGTGGPLEAMRLETVLRQLAEQFDLVVVDSPALLVAVDARLVGAVSDGSLLVVRSGRTKHRDVAAALDVLAAVAGRACGAVVNRSGAAGLAGNLLPPAPRASVARPGSVAGAALQPVTSPAIGVRR